MLVWLAIMNDDQKNSGIRQVEISSFDLRYERCRLKSEVTEKALLSSILDHGIRDPTGRGDQGQMPDTVRWF